MTALHSLDPPHRVLLEEACRIADRLDRLDRQLEGKEGWLSFRIDPDRSDESYVEVTVMIDRALAEARQQAVALKTIVAEIRQSAKRPTSDASKGAGSIADLTKRIAARREQPPG